MMVPFMLTYDLVLLFTTVGSVLVLLCHFRPILVKVTGALLPTQLNVMRHNLCQMKV